MRGSTFLTALAGVAALALYLVREKPDRLAFLLPLNPKQTWTGSDEQHLTRWLSFTVPKEKVTSALGIPSDTESKYVTLKDGTQIYFAAWENTGLNETCIVSQPCTLADVPSELQANVDISQGSTTGGVPDSVEQQ